MAAFINFDTFLVLLKASSKEVVLRLCDAAFLHRNEICLPSTLIRNVAETLSVDSNDSKQLMVSLINLIKAVIYEGNSDAASISALFPENFHKNLRELLTKIFVERFPQWRSSTISSQISLPKLVDFDWRVDLKMSSDQLSRMSVPSCIVHLQVEDPPTRLGAPPSISTHDIELSKQTLDTMLDGLGKIRDQLSAVSGK